MTQVPLLFLRVLTADLAEQQQGDVPNALAERVQRLGLKLYPSESAFPCGKTCPSFSLSTP